MKMIRLVRFSIIITSLFTGMSLNTMFIKRLDLIDIMRSSISRDLDEQFNLLTEEIKNRTNCDDKDLKKLKKKLSYFKSEYKSRWMQACRIEERFLESNKDWLDASISFPVYKNQLKRGRPEKSFESSSERSKRQKTKKLRDSTSASVLTYATQMALRSEGQPQASKVLQSITTTSPKRASKYIKAYKRSLEPQQRMSGADALSILVEAKLSRYQYGIIRSSAPEKFPSYKTVQAAKKFCYPENIVVSETTALVALQSMLNHTAKRLLLTIDSVIQTLEQDHVTLYTKWGFDGSSGHSSYKQAYYDSECSDSSVFITCIVPLRLVCGDKILWQNPRPASTRYCRPLKIEFVKESTQTSVAEKSRVDNEIKQLQNSSCLIEGKLIDVSHNLIFSMVDGKVCNALTNTTSTQKCYVCGATSKQFNNIEEMIIRDINKDNLKFGLSILHGWIRMFECLLHLSYKLPILKWQARGSDKEIVAQNKVRIQAEFKKRCGLIVDKPKPGFGNTNDGNTARRFFEHAEVSADITQIDIELIKRLHVIMIVVSSGHEIDVQKFRIFTHNTAKCFVEKYPWYNMPPTLHKYLIHGPEIISHALLPIGQLTEEAQEARNKDFKRYREYSSRKCSREKTNEDILNFFLISSDPVISSKRKLPKKNLKIMPSEALELLKPTTVQTFSDDSGERDGDDTSSSDDTRSTDNDDDDTVSGDDNDMFSHSGDEYNF